MNKVDIQNQLNSAFNYFNTELFGAKLLPVCVITIPPARGLNGYYRPERFIARSDDNDSERDSVDEIALNPDNFDRDDINILSTLVHEMIHHWQKAFGKPSRTSYHNKEWGRKMESLGLMPSSTGQEVVTAYENPTKSKEIG